MGRKQGVILSYILMIFEVLSTLLITPFIISTLGQAEYGVYKLSASITAYLLLLDLGVGNAIIRYISKYRANKDTKSERNFFGVAILFYCAIALISLVGGILLQDLQRRTQCGRDRAGQAAAADHGCECGGHIGNCGLYKRDRSL